MKNLKLNIKRANNTKLLFTALVVIGAIAFILSLPKVGQLVAPMIGQDPSTVSGWADRIFTFSVAALLLWVGFLIVGSPVIMIGLFVLSAGVMYHLLRKFGLFQ